MSFKDFLQGTLLSIGGALIMRYSEFLDRKIMHITLLEKSWGYGSSILIYRLGGIVVFLVGLSIAFGIFDPNQQNSLLPNSSPSPVIENQNETTPNPSTPQNLPDKLGV